MKIINWNCNGALRKKLPLLDKENADIIIVQECEDPSQSTKAFKKWRPNYIWFGDNKNKGIGIFAKENIKLEKLEWFNSIDITIPGSKTRTQNWNTNQLKLFLPIRVNDSFNILAVWTKGSDDQVFSYIGQLWKYLQLHSTDITKSPFLIIGDFNSNSIWDKSDRWWNHTDVVEELNTLGFESLYHEQNKEIQGKETIPTFYHQRKMDKKYHIDYCFTSKDFNESRMNIGEYQTWIEYSDHMPLLIDIISKYIINDKK